MCVALDDPECLEILRTEILPKINETHPTIPKLLVGTKADLREQLMKDGYKYNYITTEQGTQFMNDIGATMFIECSSVTGKGVEEVFDEILRMNYDVYVKGGKH